MTLQVLVSTMNNDPRQLVKTMHIDSDAIIINQCDKIMNEEFKYRNHKILVFYTTSRGIGKSRQLALSKSTANILLFADDDESLIDNYREVIENDFETNQNVDFFVYNIQGRQGDSQHNTRTKRIRWHNSLKYGTAHFCVKRQPLIDEKISFNPDFGASKYGHGEDTLFLHSCLKAKMIVMTNPRIIASITPRASTWFNGFDDDYYYDTGALFSALFGKTRATPLLIFNLLRHGASLKNIKTAINGLKEYDAKCSR